MHYLRFNKTERLIVYKYFKVFQIHYETIKTKKYIMINDLNLATSVFIFFRLILLFINCDSSVSRNLPVNHTRE